MQIIEATTEATQDPSKRYRCRHIFTDGHRCGSPSLRGEHFCYYHHTTRGFADERRERRSWTEFELPPLEDRSSVLAAITEVLQRIACDNLPVKQAGLLLYGLQIASLNLPETGEAKSKSKSDDQPPVEEVITNPRYGDLAPIAEIVEDAKPAIASPQISDLEPAILPSLNASAAISYAPEEPPQPHVISTEGAPLTAAADGPPYFAVSAAKLPRRQYRTANEIAADYSLNRRTTATPEINISIHATGTATWYPNNCHAYQKRTTRPRHPAHRYQAAQRRSHGRSHGAHGLLRA
jgi:hypothetical protein